MGLSFKKESNAFISRDFTLLLRFPLTTDRNIDKNAFPMFFLKER